MLKNRFKYQIFASIFLLLAITFSFYIDVWIGNTLLLYPVLALIYVILFFITIYQLIKSFQNKFQEKDRNIQIIIVILVLFIVTIKPFGAINFERLYGRDVLIAYSEGVAGCGQTLKFKESNKYTYLSVCFDSERKIGKYEIKNDTIFFDKKDKNPYDFGIIENKSIMFFKQDLSKPRWYKIELSLLK